MLLVLVPLVLVRIDYTFDGKVTAGFVFALGAACVLAALPFLAAGVAIAVAIRDYTRWAGRVYAADLAGAGLGALAGRAGDVADRPGDAGRRAGRARGRRGAAVRGPPRAERRAGAAVTAVAALLVVVSAATSLYYLDPWTEGDPRRRALDPAVAGDRLRPRGRRQVRAPVLRPRLRAGARLQARRPVSRPAAT